MEEVSGDEDNVYSSEAFIRGGGDSRDVGDGVSEDRQGVVVDATKMHTMASFRRPNVMEEGHTN